MELDDFNLKRLSSVQNNVVTDDELKAIEKKSGNRAFKICFPIFSIIVLIAIVFSFVYEKEFPLLHILVFIFLCLPTSVYSLKKKESYACYGIIKDKTVRCKEVHGRGYRYVPFEKTEAEGTYKHKYTLFRTICDYYYCTVEIDGKIFENVWCCGKDFSNINIGDKVIIVLDDGYDVPKIYAR